MAQNYGVQLSIDVAHFLRQINTAIKTINTDGKINPLKLSASTSALSANIRKAISEINSGEKLKNRPVNIAASESKLRQSIATAIRNINSSGYLNGKAVNIKANLKLDDAVKKARSQIADITAKSGNINVGGNANNAALNTSIANVRKELEKEGQQLLTNNEYLRERATLFTKSGTIKTSTKYGSSGENITLNATNGNLTSVTKTTDNSRIAAEQAKAETAINRTRNALSALRAEYADINSTKTIKSDTENFKILETEYNKIIQLINEFERSDNKNTAQFKVNVESKIADFEMMIERFQRAQYAPTSLRAKDVETSAAIEANRLDEFISKVKASNVPIEKMQGTIDNLKLSLSKISDAGSLTKFLNDFSIAQSEFSALKSESKALATEMSQVDAVAKQITNSLKMLENKGNQGIFLKNSGNENVVAMQKVFDNLTAKYTALQTSLKNDPSAENLVIINKELSALQNQLQKSLTNSEALKKSLKNIKMSEDLTKKANVLYGQITEYERRNESALGMVNPLSGLTFGKELEQLRTSIPNVQDLGSLDQLNSRFVTLRANVKALGKEGNTTLVELRNNAAKFIKWMGMTLLFTKVRMYFDRLFTTVLDLDTALVDLKKTFNGTEEELNDFYFEANRLAKQMGVTTAEIIKQGAAFSRLGYSSNETMKKMAEMSAMFAAISPDMNTEQAQDGLVSVIKAFNIDPENVLDGILSKVNIIGNTAATSNGEIVEMLKRSSAAMRESNNTLEETIALETAAIEVTRDAPGTGVAWKTISARLRGLDEETLQVSDDITELTGKFADFTKTAKTPGGISLFTDESKTTYKSTYQIIKELSEIWDDLTDVQTARIGEVIGGKRQLQVVSAAIENFEAAEKALDNMANSAGSAEAEMDTIRQSAAYALNELKETFTSLAQNSVSRGELKALINTGTAMLELLNGLVKTFGGLPVAIGAASAALTVFKKKGEGLLGYNAKGNFTFWGAETKNGIKSWFNEKTDPTGEKAQIKNQIAAVKAFDNAIKTNSMNLRTYNAVMKSSNDNVKRYGRAVMQGTDSTQAFNNVNRQLKTELSVVGKKLKIATEGTKQLNFAMKAFNTISSMVVSMGISWAIGKVFEAISDAVNSIENNISRIKDLNSEISGIESEIKDLNEQLADTKTRIAELQGMPKLTLLEQDELNRLIQSNDELEKQIRLKKGQLIEDTNESHKKAADILKEMTTPPDLQSDKWWNYIPLPGIKSVINLIVGANKEIKNLSLDDQLADLDEYKKTLEEINNIKASDDYLADPSKFDKEITKKENKLGELNDKIYSYYNNYWSVLQNGLDPNISNEKKYLNIINEAINDWDILQEKADTTFEKLYNNAKFVNVKNYLKELAAQGELTVGKFEALTDSEIKGIEEFKEALKSIPNTSIENVVETIIKDTENAKNEVYDFTASLEKLYEALDNIIDKQEKLADAFKKIQRGAALSAQEIYELIKEMPDLARYIERTTDGYSISDKGISAVAEKNQKQARENAEKDLENIRENIVLLEKRDELEKKRDELEKEMISSNGSLDTFRRWDNADVEYHKAVEACQGISDTLEELKSAEQAVLIAQGVLDEVFNGFAAVENYEDAKSEISEYNKEIQTLDKAIRSLNEGASLSYDEMTELVDIAPDLQGFFKEMEDGYTISADKIEWWSRKTKTARNEYIQSLIEQAEAEKKTAETERDAAKASLDAADVANKAAAAIQYSIAQQNVNNIDEVIKKYKALMNDLKSPDDKNSVSDKLQNEIDYYKNILDAVEIVRDKYTDALDNEIDTLEEVKDSLKEANDERQREIDLKEAAKNLENAKKRKVWVYSDANGFQQVQDESAVKEAAEYYRDALTDIQIAEIDKEIASREEQKEALDKNTEALTKLEQNIQDTLTVEQALADLGLSDSSDLLNLPDNVKEDIKTGLADAIVQKANKEHDGSKFTPVTTADILKSMGATVSAEDFKNAMKNILTTNSEYNIGKMIADECKKSVDETVKNVVNNNNSNVISPTINIYDAHDPEKVAEAVRSEITDIFTKLNNSIK